MSVLKEPVLVLNKNFTAIRVCSFERAIAKVFSGNAMILNPETNVKYNWQEWVEEFKTPKDKAEELEYEYITTKEFVVKLPTIIICVKYGKVPKTKLKVNRKNVYIRDGGRCIYTGEKLHYKEATVDHIIPRSKGGRNEWNNVGICSKKINVKKGNRTPEEAGMVLIRKPFEPPWNPLFTYVSDGCHESWKPFIKNDIQKK